MKMLIALLFLLLVAAIAVPVQAQEDQNPGASGSPGYNTQTAPSTGATPGSDTKSGMTHKGSKHGKHMGSSLVREVQQALKDKGNDPGPIDGKLGPKTKAAIREFQKANSLPVTGKIDKETESKLGVGSTTPSKS
jgi:peptidoglycan hydrolase-like protein with peptidoglycan-binding domain